MLLLIGLTFVSGIGAYTYWEDTHAKNHLEALTARAAAETAQQAAGQIHAAEADSDERKAEVAQWQTSVEVVPRETLSLRAIRPPRPQPSPP
jgi:hypothetical protein